MATLDSNAWVSLAETKEFMGISGSSDDDLLTSLINYCFSALEDYLGRQIKSRTYTEERYDGDGTDTLIVYQYPITAISSIYDDPSLGFNSDTLIDSDDYLIDDQDRYPGRIRLAGEDALSLSFAKGKTNIKITYTAGYVTIPNTLKFGLLTYITSAYNKRKGHGTVVQSLGGQSVTWERMGIPREVKDIINDYKKFTV